MASSWQKKNRRASRWFGSYQCSSSRRVIPVTPGQCASRQAWTNGRSLVHQRQFDELARIVEALRIGRRHDVSRRSPAMHLRKDAVFPVVAPVAARLGKGRIEDQVPGAQMVFALWHVLSRIVLDGSSRKQVRPVNGPARIQFSSAPPGVKRRG